MSLLSHFPSSDVPRTSQVTLLKAIDAAFSSGKKFVIANAPTGSGKSFLAKTLANSSREVSNYIIDGIHNMDAFSVRYNPSEKIPQVYDQYTKVPRGGTFVLTITKNLQDQYKQLFPETKTLKGKNNYRCVVDNIKMADNAPCISNTALSKRCEYNGLCPHLNARNNSIISKFSVLNYKMFSVLPRHIKGRQYIVCDEASELPNELVSIYSRVIPLKVLRELRISTHNIPYENSMRFIGWLNDLVDVLMQEVARLEGKAKKDPSNQSLLRHIKNYRNLHSELEVTISLWDKAEYVINQDSNFIKICPLKVDKLSSTIFDYADKVLLMSGTIIDPDKFAKSLGITDYEYVEVDSEFDPKKAPIYTVNQSRSLNRTNIDRLLPTIAKEIQDICRRHKGEKGIIHTHTNDITRYLHSNLKGNRFIFRLDENENDYILDQHISSDGDTILVSPSLSYGVDLKGDLAKFQIIVKAAFLPLNDPRVAKLFKEDKQWYVNEMLNTLIQACGRGVRSKHDECVTYILDGNITTNVIQNRSILPKYFMERFI